MSERVVYRGGCGPSFLGLLALLFIGLRLGGVIAWSWWWVLAPLWVPVVLAVVAVVFFLLMHLATRGPR